MYKFRWITWRYMGATDKNVPKMAKKRVLLVIRCGFYLGPPWTVLAEILGDNSPIVGLSCVQISLGCDEAGGSSGWKRPKNRPKNQFFEKVPSSYRGQIFLYRAQILPYDPRICRKNFSPVRGFLVLARSDPIFDMQCDGIFGKKVDRHGKNEIDNAQLIR